MLRQDLEQILAAAVEDGITPSAVCAVALNGNYVPTLTFGHVATYADDGTQLPEAQRVPVTERTVYDLASITKVFTAITALSLVDDGLLELDVPVSTYLDEYKGREITLRHLLTHTSGLPGTWTGWRSAFDDGHFFDREELLKDLLETAPETAPGAALKYSCLGYNTIMALAERVTRQPWASLVHDRVLDPVTAPLLYSEFGSPVIAEEEPSFLGFYPDPARCAATEIQPEFGRGTVQGIVHDEAAWSLGGAGGNAGLFATADALLAFAEILRTGVRGIISDELAAEMWRDQLPDILGPQAARDAEFGHGLGLRIHQESWMGVDGVDGRGHSGFTGTSMLVDRDAGISVVLLTNRVHPNRDASDVAPLRRAVAEAVYNQAKRGPIPRVY